MQLRRTKGNDTTSLIASVSSFTHHLSLLATSTDMHLREGTAYRAEVTANSLYLPRSLSPSLPPPSLSLSLLSLPLRFPSHFFPHLAHETACEIERVSKLRPYHAIHAYPHRERYHPDVTPPLTRNWWL